MLGSTTNITPVNSASSSPLTQSQKKATESKMDFLKLLTLQLRSQNPLKPYDNQEFASQLAQFSQLEQLTNIKSILEAQNNTFNLMSQTMNNTAIPGMLGKNAKVMWNASEFDGTSPLQIGYNLPRNSESGTLEIKDHLGRVVKTIELKGLDLANGQHKITWDGKDAKGELQNPGKYSFEFKFKDKEGNAVNFEQYTFGKISSVRFSQDGAKIIINNQEVPLSNIADISID